jgi:hypothetical protein
LRQRHGYEHGFPLIRSLRASAQRSTSVLFSFVLSLLIVAGSFAIRQSKTILARSYEAVVGFIDFHEKVFKLKFGFIVSAGELGSCFHADSGVSSVQV